MNGTTMWSCDTELCTNGVEATKCWVFVAHFSIYSTSRCRCHTGTDIPRLRGHTLQINQVVRTVRHRISCCARTIHWKCDAQIQNPQIKSPPALWKHLSFQCLGVIVTLNGKSASMLLEPTKNKLKQWRVIEKSVNKCNFFSQMFWIITKWMKKTEKQICEDQIVTSKQSHILLYQGLLFLTRSTCVIVDARSFSLILSLSWLNIWFEPMRWLVLCHVIGINSATTTCKPRPVNRDLCVSLAFEQIKKRTLMPRYA